MLHGSSFHVGRKVCIIILFFFCSFDVMSVCFSFFLFFSSLVITHTFFFSLLRSFFFSYQSSTGRFSCTCSSSLMSMYIVLSLV